MAIVVVTTKVKTQIKFIVGKESRFLRDIYPDVRDLEFCQLPANYLDYYKSKCIFLSRKYGMRIQFDTPDVYSTYTRTRFRYLEQDWRYGVVKGAFDSRCDKTSLDTAVREFNEEVMPFDDRGAFQKQPTVVHERDLYTLHIDDPTDLCETIASRANAYYGELFEMELRTWDEMQIIWPNLNVVSKRSLEFVMASTL